MGGAVAALLPVYRIEAKHFKRKADERSNRWPLGTVARG